MRFENQDGIPLHSLETLRRPLTDDEKREIWGDRGGGVSREQLEELARILQSGDAESRALAEMCLRSLICQSMSDRLLDPASGYVSRFGQRISEGVDRFNRYLG